MKRFITLIIIVVISNNCMGQMHTSNLQKLDFKDKMLEQILINISKSSCFDKNGHYVLDFFKSNLSSDKYYLSIDKLIINDNTLTSIKYYVEINDIILFVPQTMPNWLFNILSVQKKFSLREEKPYPGGDYNFLIYGTKKGYFKVIYNSCEE